MLELKHAYPAVARARGVSYGGDQGWAGSRTMRLWGCGVTSVTDLLWYLAETRRCCADRLFSSPSGALTLRRYRESVEEIRRRIPLFPGFGTNGVFLTWALNHSLRRSGIPLRGRWCVSGKKLWSRMEGMLSRDLPVIFSVGPNFPRFWKRGKLTFYVRTADGQYRPGPAISAHYVNVTGMDEEWLRVSSWGRMFYVNRNEYEDYVRRCSCTLVSNLIDLRQIGPWERGKESP